MTRFVHQENAKIPMCRLRCGKGQAEEHRASRNKTKQKIGQRRAYLDIATIRK